MGCPKCGYSGKNSIYHWGTGETECERCRHDYVRGRSDSKKSNGSFSFPTFNPGKDIRYSNDVWIGPDGKTSMFRPVGGVYAGMKSPLIGDKSILDHDFRPIGRTDGNGYFVPSWRI